MQWTLRNGSPTQYRLFDDLTLTVHRAIQFLADTRFHRSLWLPPDAKGTRTKPLRVTYAELGQPDGHPVLVCGGLVGSRYTLALADSLALKHGIRLLWPDKPGIGGSDAVALPEKVTTWLGETPSPRY